MSCAATKPIFPIPINGQALMFPATSGLSSRCDHAHGTIHALSHPLTHSRCSCGESIPPPSTNPGPYNRLLLPATSHNNDPLRLQTGLSASVATADSWLHLPSGTRTNYESLLLNGFPLYGKFTGESYPSLDYALLVNARRKNATRETTSTLKTWLNEHKKNPYPSKGEKVMLAILTKMTLTQVSTWFANARRRLKKENKMTWSPRKKSGEKKGNENDELESVDSDSDVEGMDVDVDGVLDSTEKENQEAVFAADSSSIKQEILYAQSELSIQRPSVIRTVESPTFNDIKNRFKDETSPVQNLQKWVDGCVKPAPDEMTEFPDDFTPPSTPIENKVTTFSAQTLFEAFDATKSKSGTSSNTSKPPSVESSYTKEPLHLIFSSKLPVCSSKVTEPQHTSIKCELPILSTEVPTGVWTPQPSPKNETHFIITKDGVIASNTTTTLPQLEPQPQVRVQGLTTSRELEAVLALANLCKT